MVVGVDQAWNDHFAGHVQNHIGVLRQLVAWADLFDYVVFDEHTAAFDFAALAIHGHQKFGVLDQ
ncbi:hypothetical protein D3C77_786030 [compost metagenome]